jgi:hypothetical protein
VTVVNKSYPSANLIGGGICSTIKSFDQSYEMHGHIYYSYQPDFMVLISQVTTTFHTIFSYMSSFHSGTNAGRQINIKKVAQGNRNIIYIII